MYKSSGLVLALLVSTLGFVPSAYPTEINQEVARAYNEGIVRCTNAECAKYLYACFRTYGTTTIDEFLVCGTQASRLNDDQLVVANPSG